MPRCLVAYFSQGGTTTRVAEAIAAGLRRGGCEVDLTRIGSGPPRDPSSYDLIGIGSPVYYFRPPFNVSDYAARLPRLDGRAAFVFVLYGRDHGGAGRRMRSALERKGARVIGTLHTRGVDRFLGYLRLGFLFSPHRPTFDEIVAAETFGLKLAGRLAGGASGATGKVTADGGAVAASADITRAAAGTTASAARTTADEEASTDERPLPPLYRLERFLTNRWLVRNLHTRLFRVDARSCRACDVCMKICPMENIRPGEGGRPVWGSECLLCLSCESICPKGAITSSVDSPIFRLFLRYSLRRASRDPAIPHERVTASSRAIPRGRRPRGAGGE